MYYSEWVWNFEVAIIGFLIHKQPITYGSDWERYSGFCLSLGPIHVNKKVRPKTRILKISGGKYFKSLCTEPGGNNFVKFLTINQKFSDEEELRIKSGIEMGEICIGKQRE